MSNDQLYLKKQDAVGVIYLNRPDRKNAISYDMWIKFANLMQDIETDDQIRVVQIRSTSPEIFTAGADIEEFEQTAHDTEFREKSRLSISEACRLLRESSKPSIAVIQGGAYGGGAALALSCDMRYGDYTTSFAFPPAKLGLIYPLQETARILDLAGPAMAKELLFTGRTVRADEAQHIGLVNQLFTADQLGSQVDSITNMIANNAQASIRGMKEVIRLINRGQREEDAISAEIFNAAYRSADFAEGAAAFREKRKPKFK